MIPSTIPCPRCNKSGGVDRRTKAKGQIVYLTFICPECKLRIDLAGIGDEQALGMLRRSWRESKERNA